ncbi:MAG: S41 family peptidase [Bacteroidetes bacterium]|nr:S41 family peptidase [Bacteroidota bacterium]
MNPKLLSTMLGFGMFFMVHAQQADCITDFNYLVNKMKTDYPGYHDKVTKNTEKELADLEVKLRAKITEVPDSCGRCLRAYTSWFKDEHLFVSRIRKNKQPAPGQPVKPARQHIVPDRETIAELGRKSTTIEGIWVSFRGKIAVKKADGENKYYGTVIQYPGYEPGQVIFEFIPREEHQFSAKNYPVYNNFEPVDCIASLHLDDRIFEIHGDNNRFVRQSASPVYDKALLYSYLAEYPNGVNIYPLAASLDDSTYYLRVTGFEDDLAENLVRPHWKEIMARPNLIIDIRHNGGGQDEYYQVLSSLVYTTPYESKGVEWLASEGNIRNFEEALKLGDIRNGEEGVKWINELLAVMKKNVGGFVIHPLMGKDVVVKEDTVYPFPKRVGIIIDEGNGSSAEQFILEAKESKKVVLFGNHNTAGVLDYSNRVNEELPSGKYEIYWPMTRSRRLPEHPIDNIGIAPDVMIPYPETKQLYDRLDEWVYFVKKYLEFSGQQN